jgi:hypothetical protein
MAGWAKVQQEVGAGEGYRTAAASAVSFSRELITSFVNEDKKSTFALTAGGSFAQRKADETALAKSFSQPAVAAAGGGGGGQPVILQYAQFLGMDPAEDTELLWIAQQALTAPLPPNWAEHADPSSGDSYYYNSESGETVWEHPCDDYFRSLYKELKGAKVAKVVHRGAVRIRAACPYPMPRK